MRDFASCFSEYVVQVSDTTSCSSYSNASCISPSLKPTTTATTTIIPSIQNTVSCLYRTILSSSQKQILTTLTWCNHGPNHGLTVTFNDDPNAALKLNTNSRLFRKLKGSKPIESHNMNIEIFWDLSTARFESGPEPLSGFYLFVTVDSELGPIIGDMAHEASIKKLKSGAKTAKSTLISRREHFSGNTYYSTKAKFCETGSSHEIVIQSSGANEGLKYPALSVCIDKKTVIRVKRLQWNFRGNQTVFLDGLLVDLMWDVHDWFYEHGNNPVGSGCGVFMFRTRSGMDSRLWLEEKMVQKDEDKVDFSLMICACKNS